LTDRLASLAFCSEWAGRDGDAAYFDTLACEHEMMFSKSAERVN